MTTEEIIKGWIDLAHEHFCMGFAAGFAVGLILAVVIFGVH